MNQDLEEEGERGGQESEQARPSRAAQDRAPDLPDSTAPGLIGPSL
jgi:hypothetical protein